MGFSIQSPAGRTFVIERENGRTVGVVTFEDATHAAITFQQAVCLGIGRYADVLRTPRQQTGALQDACRDGYIELNRWSLEMFPRPTGEA